MTKKWEKLCPTDDIPGGQRKLFPLSALDVIVFNTGKRFHACAAECPNDGSSLLEGPLTGHVVSCQTDGYKFDLSTGKCISEAGMDVPVFPVEVRDGWVWVKF
jgi:nitrite reductase/ring-hydroxylating ferredoxin subunit